ncbi:MAG: hypothetical protein KC425_02415, partial [Anaerolineales bacterium]|nr:hypothetical protein [Anaerolineales bacterium]
LQLIGSRPAPPELRHALYQRCRPQLDDEGMRVHRLLPLAPLAPPELAGDVLQAILAIGRDDDRARLLTAVTPRLAPAQLGALLPLAAQFAEPYPFQALLAAVVARLPAAWLPEALRLVHARAGVLLPPTALAAVMARWDDLTAVAGVDAEAELVLTLEAFARGGSAFLLAALRVLLPRLAHVDGGLPGRLADELVARES